MARDDNSTYYDEGGIATFDVIKAKLTPEEFRGFLKGTALQYLCRAAFKGDEARDLEKASNYTRWLWEECPIDLFEADAKEADAKEAKARLAWASLERRLRPFSERIDPPEVREEPKTWQTQAAEDGVSFDRLVTPVEDEDESERIDPPLLCAMRRSPDNTWVCDLCHSSWHLDDAYMAASPACIKGRQKRG